LPRGLDSEVVTSKSTTGQTLNTPKYKEQNFTISTYRGVEIALDMSYVNQLPDTRRDYLGKLLGSRLNTLRRAINQACLQQQVLNFGVNVQTGLATAQTIPLLAANGRILEEGIADLDDSLDLNRFTATPLVIGRGNFRKMNKLRGIGGAVNDSGIDISRVPQLISDAGYAYFNDHQIEALIGANNCVVIDPGAVQLVTYNEYKGENVFEDVDGAMFGTLNDPEYANVEYDMKVLFDRVREKWFISLAYNFDLFFLPSDVYGVDDSLEGNNGTLRFNFTKQA